MTTDDIPESIAQSEMEIGGIKVKVHVLSDGRRVIEAADMERLMVLLFDGFEGDGAADG